VQINGITLTKRQKTLIRGALLREHARITDLMRILYQANLDHDTRARATTAILAPTDEIVALMNLINEDKENHNA
jgi:hypothetical protein